MGKHPLFLKPHDNFSQGTAREQAASMDTFGDFVTKYKELGGAQISAEIKEYMETR